MYYSYMDLRSFIGGANRTCFSFDVVEREKGRQKRNEVLRHHHGELCRGHVHFNIHELRRVQNRKLKSTGVSSWYDDESGAHYSPP